MKSRKVQSSVTLLIALILGACIVVFAHQSDGVKPLGTTQAAKQPVAVTADSATSQTSTVR